ncbi:MAG: hypothetical protein PHU44_12655 [Syntrophales bacterium]|nr:hypothetical protein [Syntrophales bacterium]MDD5641382.1 hypothetical protein [Syntrophales bacterium]
MNRLALPHFSTFYRRLTILLVLLLLVAGCAPGTTPPPQPPVAGTTPATPALSSPQAVAALKKAQEAFNAAVQADQPTVAVPAASRQKYQEVVDTLKQEVLDQGNDSLKVSAYALLAFSQWRLGQYAQAVKTGEKGRQLYETAKLTSNPREYGMCLMVRGLAGASQTYQEYRHLQTSPTKEQAQNLTGRLEQAMRTIDSGNTYWGRQDDVALYANLWQLALVDAAVRIWTSGLPREVAQPEVCRWLGRAEQVFAKFPNPPYHWQDLALTYKSKFEKKKKAECQGR